MVYRFLEFWIYARAIKAVAQVGLAVFAQRGAVVVQKKRELLIVESRGSEPMLDTLEFKDEFLFAPWTFHNVKMMC